MAKGQNGRPLQASLRRAVSTVYYALFHALARDSANLLIGGSGSSRSKRAWLEVYRALSHGYAKSACADQRVIRKFPVAIADFGEKFVEMQQKRHDADYNPYARFYKSDVLADIAITERAILAFLTAPKKDRQASASWVLFRHTKRSQ